MKIEKNLYLSKLFDAYGKLLSARQKEICYFVLNDDLTLSEIAQNLGISRQAVLDGLNKAEKKLLEFEEQLSFVKQISLLEDEIKMLKNKLRKEG